MLDAGPFTPDHPVLETPQLVCVTIPVYQAFESLPANELLAWRQCLRVLKQYHIFLFCPPQLATGPYLADARQHGVECQVSIFKSEFFANIDGYNRLMLSRPFYARFQAYDYLLLYQLDAFIFRDDLLAWCARGYSYIGAPWLTNYLSGKAQPRLRHVGNGGFALRKVADFLRVLDTFAVARSWSVVTQEHFAWGLCNGLLRLPSLLRVLLLGNNTHWLLNDFHRYRPVLQEDNFWGEVCSELFHWFKVPVPQQALAFSFEAAPGWLYKQNNYQLPMGCHAWEKYEPQFWQPFINRALENENA